MRAAIVLSLAVGVATGSAFAQTIAITSELAAVIEAAKKEGQLDLRSTNNVLGGPEEIGRAHV